MDSSTGESTELVSVQNMLISSIVLMSITAIFISARFVVGLRHIGKIFIDDVLAAFGLFILAGNFALNYKAILILSDLVANPPANPIPRLNLIFKLGEANIFTFGAVTWFSKAPILFLYMRLFGVKRWMRITCIITLVVSAVIVLAATIYAGVQCYPHGTYTPVYAAKCGYHGALGGVINGFVGLAFDVLCFILPLPILYKLNLPLERKIGIMLVFATGIFVIIVSAASIYFKMQSLSGELADAATSGVLTCIECSIALMFSCVPSVHCAWCLWVTKSEWYTRLISVASKISLVSGSGTRKTKVSVDEPRNDESDLSGPYKRFYSVDETPDPNRIALSTFPAPPVNSK